MTSMSRGFCALSIGTALCARAAAGCVGDGPEPLTDDRGAADVDPPPHRGAPPTQPGVGAHERPAGPGAEGERDPFEILAEQMDEGPPEIRARLHSCQKMRIDALRSVLIGFGVSLDASGDPPPAGQLFRKGLAALGAADYDGRAGEAAVWSTAGATKLFDVFVRAAPEIIAHLGEVAQCQVGGRGPEMFDDGDRCNEAAVTCLIGRPATPEHLALCDSAVRAASDIDKGKTIAVASLLSAAHLCE